MARFVAELPEVRARLAEDVEAAFEGDPAAKGFGEIVVAYPSIHAIAIYRLAHELHHLGVPQIPRIMSEHAHARTGIDIHPGARDRPALLHRPRHRRRDRRDERDRRPRAPLPRRHPRRVLAAPGPDPARHEAPPDDRRRRHHLPRRDDPRRGDGDRERERRSNGNAYVTESVPPGSRVVAEPPRQEIRQRADRTRQLCLDWDL